MPVQESSDSKPRLLALEMAVQKLQEQSIWLHYQLGEQSKNFDLVVKELRGKLVEGNALNADLVARLARLEVVRPKVEAKERAEPLPIPPLLYLLG